MVHLLISAILPKDDDDDDDDENDEDYLCCKTMNYRCIFENLDFCSVYLRRSCMKDEVTSSMYMCVIFNGQFNGPCFSYYLQPVTVVVLLKK
jgi:hypothetical protein